MDHWPFIIAAYALTVLGTLGLAAWSFATMRAREHKAAALRQERGA
ncbi:MAG: hypothetical protein ABR601_07930 [Parasphingopyxis sp.]|nr:hypothetical protein [Sphingomonadales bacterium]